MELQFIKREYQKLWAEKKRREKGQQIQSEMNKTKVPHYFAIKAKERRDNETAEERELRLEKRRDKYKLKENIEERKLKRNKLFKKQRENETNEQRELRLKKRRENYKLKKELNL